MDHAQASVLLLGSDGQLGLSIKKLIDSKALIIPAREVCDFQHPDKLADLIIRLQPRIVINAVAYTSVEKAEIESDLAYRINFRAVEMLAKAAKNIGALLVHFSTDYVFDGSGNKPWREEDEPAPLNVYGASKWKGEQAILASGCQYLIFRTSWLHSPYRHNFLKTILRLGKERESLSVVCDQIGAPTSAAMLAEVIGEAIKQTLVNPMLCGLYHVAAAGETSWYDYARFIFTEANKQGAEFKMRELRAVSSDIYSATVKRPLNSRLDTAKFSAVFGLTLPHWHEGVKVTLRQLLEEGL